MQIKAHDSVQRGYNTLKGKPGGDLMLLAMQRIRWKKQRAEKKATMDAAIQGAMDGNVAHVAPIYIDLS